MVWSLPAMNRRMGTGAFLAVLSGCAATAATAPPRVSPPPERAASEAPRRPEGPPDPPGTRRVGVGEWSLAVGEDWERREGGQGGTYGLSLGDAGVVLVNVSSEPRPRGAEADVLAEFVAGLTSTLAVNGLFAAGSRELSVAGAPGRELSFRPQFAGEQVTTLTRAIARGSSLVQVWCTVPATRPGAAQSDCRPVIASLRSSAPRPAPAGARVVQRREASIVVPEAWITQPSEGDHADEGSLTVRADRTPGGALVSVDAAPLEGTAPEYFRQVIARYREEGATIVRQRAGSSRGERWFDAEVSTRVPATVVLLQRLALRGDRLWAISCAQPEAEVAAGRDRCAAVFGSFRFDSP